MARPLACLGDKTTYGKVLSGTATWYEGDRPIAQTGDLARCDKCDGSFPIIGTATDWCEEQPYVATGDRVACRCPDHVVYGSTTQITTSPASTRTTTAQAATLADTPAANTTTSPPPGATAVEPARVFTRSCLGTTKDTCSPEPISNFGRVAVIGPTTRETAAGTALAGVSIGRVAGSGLLEGLGAWAVRAVGASASSLTSAATPLLLALWPSDLADGTLYTEEQLRQMSQALTRVRFQFRRDVQGVTQIYGFHTFSHYGGEDRVPVRRAHWNANKSAMEAHLDGLTITWTPNSGPLVNAPTTYPGARPDVLDNILVHPIPNGRDSQITTYPGQDTEDITWQDVILTFPADSGVPPLYLVFAKPAVRPLEVGQFNDLSSRSRNDGLDIDHIPSQRALEAMLERNFPDMLKVEIDSYLRRAPSIAIPADVHRKYSETYGGRNTKSKKTLDAADLRTAVDSNFDANKIGLLEQGFSETDIEIARDQLHTLSKKQGWY